MLTTSLQISAKLLYQRTNIQSNVACLLTPSELSSKPSQTCHPTEKVNSNSPFRQPKRATRGSLQADPSGPGRASASAPSASPGASSPKAARPTPPASTRKAMETKAREKEVGKRAHQQPPPTAQPSRKTPALQGLHHPLLVLRQQGEPVDSMHLTSQQQGGEGKCVEHRQTAAGGLHELSMLFCVHDGLARHNGQDDLGRRCLAGQVNLSGKKNNNNQRLDGPSMSFSNEA